MTATILALVSTFAFAAPTTVSQPTTPTEHHIGIGKLGLPGGGGDQGKECHGDIDIDVSCGLVLGLDFWLECNPLAVEAACYAKLGEDCGLQAFLDCEVELVAECQAALEADGAVFCDGHFKGDAGCWDDIDEDHDNEGGDSCEGEEDLDVDLDLDLCLDLDLDLNLDCEVEVDAECYAACDPIAVEAWCYAELGDDCSNHEFAQCQAEVLAQCQADCEAGGAVFCDGSVYAGAELCLGIDIGLHL